MKSRSRLLLITTLIAVMVVGLTACSSGGGGLGGTRFYSLTPVAATVANRTQTTKQGIRMGVGPIRIPRLLRRPQSVTRKSNTEKAMAEKHQWGGLLKEDLSRVLTDNFAALLGTENIEQFPWKHAFKPHYNVRVDIDQLDGEQGGDVTLKVRWRLMKGREEIRVSNSTFKARAKRKDYNAYVKAQSQVLYQFSQAVVAEMRK